MHLSALARRLNVNKSVISRRKSRQDFEQWSKDRDPDGVAWVYNTKDAVFARANAL